MSFEVGNRVRIKDEFDPMFAFNQQYGFTSPGGTIEEIWDPETVLVIWDSSEGEAQGAGAPSPINELEPL